MPDSAFEDRSALALPPAPREEPQQLAFFGEVHEDPYLWLEDFEAPEPQAWVAAERAHARAFLDRLPIRQAFRERLARLEIRRRVVDAPVERGGILFYRREDPSYPRPVLEARRGPDGDPWLVYDPNAEGPGNLRIDYWQPSLDGRLVAVAVSRSGNEQSVIRLVEVEGGRVLSEEIEGCDYGSVGWIDATRFYYTRLPGAGQFGRASQGVRLHVVGTDWREDALVYEHPGGAVDAFHTLVGSLDGQVVAIMGGSSGFPLELFLLLDGASKAVQIAGSGHGAHYFLEGFRGPATGPHTAYVLTTDEAPLGRVMAFDTSSPRREHWREVIPQGSDVILNVVVTAGGLAVETLHLGASKLLHYDFDGKLLGELPLPGVGTIGIYSRLSNNSRLLSGNAGSPTLFVRYSSYVYPFTVLQVDVAARTATPFDPSPFPFDPADFEARQVWVLSRDGTRVPMTVVQRVGTQWDGECPTLLCGYGGWGISWTPQWQPRYLAWLAQGGVLASVNVRGGNEFGQAWHEAGRGTRKQHSFDDFIAAAEWLVAHGVTRPARLATEGASAGGLLVAAAMVQRPELFGAVAAIAASYDMLRYHLDPRARFAVDEYGTVEDEVGYRTLAAYSPYHNLKPATPYPATMLVAAADDQRVPPAHAAKMGAAMRKVQPGPGPIMLYVAERGGHLMGGPDFDADVLAFLWTHTQG